MMYVVVMGMLFSRVVLANIFFIDNSPAVYPPINVLLAINVFVAALTNEIVFSCLVFIVLFIIVLF